MTNWTGRNKPITSWGGRTGPQSDLGHLETQLGILNTNDGDRIIFNTGIFYDKPTQWNGRTLIT